MLIGGGYREPDEDDPCSHLNRSHGSIPYPQESVSQVLIPGGWQEQRRQFVRPHAFVVPTHKDRTVCLL